MKRQRYVGDSRGTVYELVAGDAVDCPWTLVVCEDRPGLYSRLLADVVTSGLVGKAMTVPFTTKTVGLLTEGHTMILETSLSVENLDQCVFVLDMDATYADTDLLPREDCAFVGGELYHRLHTGLRERTYLVSLKAPLDPEYYHRYPELTRIHVHPSLEEKKEDAAEGGGSTLAEGTANLIREFILQTKGELDQPTFAPVAEMRRVYEMYDAGGGDGTEQKRRTKTDELGNPIEERRVTKVTVSFDGSKPVDVKAMPGAHYLFMMLQHPGQLLETARLAAVRSPGAIDEREKQIDHTYDADGVSQPELSTASGRVHTTLIPDDAAIRDCEGQLGGMLDGMLKNMAEVVAAKAAKEANASRRQALLQLGEAVPSARNAKSKGKQILSLLQQANPEAEQIVRYIQSADYRVVVGSYDGRWKVSALPSQRRGGKSTGERSRPSSSGTVRKALDRFLKQEIRERLPRLYEHIRNSIELTDDSPTCLYKGNVSWSFGKETDWAVSIDRIVHGARKQKVQRGATDGDVDA